VPLPLVQIQTVAATPIAAQRLVEREIVAFETYLRGQQDAAKIPTSQRVVVQVVSHADGAVTLPGGGKTVPVVIFLTVMLAVVALAFVLENVRPRVRLVTERDVKPDTARSASA
jgi:hypothetical protein